MKKTMNVGMLLVCFVSVFAASVFADDLSNYPSLFMKGSNLDVITVVGNKAPATHVLAQSQIVLALTEEVNKQVPGLTRLSSEIDRIENINIISIGNACDNSISAEILGNPNPCNKGLVKGKATLELRENNNGRYHLVLNAYSDVGVRKLAEVLANSDEFPLSGTSFEISVANEEERDFSGFKTEVKPVTVKETVPSDDKETKEEVKNTVSISATEKNETEGTQDNQDEGLGFQSEPEPILKEEDNLLIKFINWLKNLFG